MEKPSFKKVKEFASRHKQCLFVAAVFVFFAANFNSYVVWSDGFAHYTLMKSMAQDLDFELTNQVMQEPDQHIYLVTWDPKHERFNTNASFGTALFNAPFYIVALALDGFFQAKFSAELGVQGTVEELWIHMASVNISSNFYGILTLFICLGILGQLKLKKSSFTVLAVFVSTPLLYYSVFVPSFTHAVDAFVISLFVFLFLFLRDKNPKYQFFVGALLAASMWVRYANAVFFVFLFVYYIYFKKMGHTKHLGAGFLSLIWVLPFYWNAHIGAMGEENIALIASSSAAPIPAMNFLNILLNPVHGLFLWSPLTVLSIIGLIYLVKEKRGPGVFFLGMFLSLTVAYSFFSEWSGGWSFSQRYLTSLFPVFVVGYSVFLKKHRKLGIALGAVLALYSLTLMFTEHFGFIDGVEGTPFDMVKGLLNGKITVQGFMEKFYRFSLLDNLAGFFK